MPTQDYYLENAIAERDCYLRQNRQLQEACVKHKQHIAQLESVIKATRGPGHHVICSTADALEWFVKDVGNMALCDSAPWDRELADIAEGLQPYLERLRKLQGLGGL